MDSQEAHQASATLAFATIEGLANTSIPSLAVNLSPDVNALAMLLAFTRKAIAELKDAAMELEDELVKAMPNKQHEVPGIGMIEKHAGASRKGWKKDELIDVLVHVVSSVVPTMFDPESGEAVNHLQVARDVLDKFLVAATPSWKVTGLRQFGIDPDQFCETSWGRKTVEIPPLPLFSLTTNKKEESQ